MCSHNNKLTNPPLHEEKNQTSQSRVYAMTWAAIRRVSQPSWIQPLLERRPGPYLWTIVAVALAASATGFRRSSVFACQPPEVDSDSYLAYCGSTAFGDYDYGAFWFDLEPAATRAARDAQVLFVGNSRTQFGLSSESTDEWFAAADTTYYLLGFAYDGNHLFAEPLLRRLQPKAQAYVVNLDLFFEAEPTPPARVVMYDESAPARYKRKKLWQYTQSRACALVGALCGAEAAFVRSRMTGSWRIDGGQFVGGPVSYDRNIDAEMVKVYTDAGRRFLDGLRVPSECQILTVVPTVDTPIATAREIASALGRTFIAPELDSLHTFDGSHLDQASAERWSQAFLAEAAHQMKPCLTARTRVASAG